MSMRCKNTSVCPFLSTDETIRYCTANCALYLTSAEMNVYNQQREGCSFTLMAEALNSIAHAGIDTYTNM